MVTLKIIRKMDNYPPSGFGSGYQPPLPGATACLAAKPPANSVNSTNAAAMIRELI